MSLFEEHEILQKVCICMHSLHTITEVTDLDETKFPDVNNYISFSPGKKKKNPIWLCTPYAVCFN